MVHLRSHTPGPGCCLNLWSMQFTFVSVPARTSGLGALESLFLSRRQFDGSRGKMWEVIVRGPASCHLPPPHSPARIEGAVTQTSAQSSTCQVREQVTWGTLHGSSLEGLSHRRKYKRRVLAFHKALCPLAETWNVLAQIALRMQALNH